MDLGRFLVPFGEASERYFGDVFLCLLLPYRGPFTTFWQGISSLLLLWLPCVLLPCWCALVFSVVPCSPFPRVRAQRASERSERSARSDWVVFPCVSCFRLRPGAPLVCLISLVFSLCGFVSPLFFGMTALPVPMPRQVLPHGPLQEV